MAGPPRGRLPSWRGSNKKSAILILAWLLLLPDVGAAGPKKGFDWVAVDLGRGPCIRSTWSMAPTAGSAELWG